MAMNREIEHHIRLNQDAGNATGVEALKALQTQFNILRDAEILIERPADTPEVTPVQEPSQLQQVFTVPREWARLKPGEKYYRFAKLLQEFRLKQGLNTRELAVRAGYKPEYVSALEDLSRTRPPLRTVKSLARALNLTTQEEIALVVSLQ